MISKKSRLLPTSGGRLDDSAYSLYLLLNSGGRLDDFQKSPKSITSIPLCLHLSTIRRKTTRKDIKL